MNATHAKTVRVFVSSLGGANEGEILAGDLDLSSGNFKVLHESKDVGAPFFFDVTPDGKHLIAIDVDHSNSSKQEFLAAYSIEKSSGALTRINRQPIAGSGPCYVDIASDGHLVAVANYSSGNVLTYPLNAMGELGSVVSNVQHSGSSIDSTRQGGPFAHCIEISPNTKFALAADLGIDKVLVYRVDASTGRLRSASGQPFARVAAGSGPRHIAFHPNGANLYLINELKNTVTVYDFDSQQGTLGERQTVSTLPADFVGKSYCADVKVTPNGKYVYGTNRGHDSIAVFRAAHDGRLARIEIIPSRGEGPQNLLITPDGRWLLCANMPGNSVAVFRIDPASGRLTSWGKPMAVRSPSCLRVWDAS